MTHLKYIPLAACALFFFSYGQLFAADPVIKEILRTTKSWNGAPLPGFRSGTPEFRVLTFKIAPGGQTTIHIHPLNGAGYLLAGELTIRATDDPYGSFADPKRVTQTKISAGEAWTEPVNSWHYGENTGKVDAEFVVIFAGEEGTAPVLSLGTKMAK